MGKRMLAPCFDCSDFAEKIRFINATARGHRDEVRLTHGESTRLVDHQRVDLFERLQSLGVANENAVLGALAGPGHDRHRRCEAECAWTGNDENGDRVNKCIGKRGEWPPRSEAQPSELPSLMR